MYVRPITVTVGDEGSFTITSGEEAVAKYNQWAKARWERWRADILGKCIVDQGGNIHPLPDPGPYPGDVAAG